MWPGPEVPASALRDVRTVWRSLGLRIADGNRRGVDARRVRDVIFVSVTLARVGRNNRLVRRWIAARTGPDGDKRLALWARL